MEKENKKKEIGAKLTSKFYKDFLKGEFIKTIGIDVLTDILENINHVENKYKQEARAFMIVLYYFGSRPAEILNLKGENIFKSNNYVYIHFKTLKKGRARTLGLPTRKKFISEFYNFAQRVFPTEYLFRHYRSEYVRTYTIGKGENTKEIKTNEVSNKLRYHFYKWISGVIEDRIPPYYLRHNRFSKMMEKGADIRDIMSMKGALTEKSVFPYIHLSKSGAKKLSRFID